MSEQLIRYMALNEAARICLAAAKAARARHDLSNDDADAGAADEALSLALELARLIGAPQ